MTPTPVVLLSVITNQVHVRAGIVRDILFALKKPFEFSYISYQAKATLLDALSF